MAKCAFSGQQCCSSLTISLFGAGINTAINNYAPRLVSGFATAQDAVNELRNATKGTIISQCDVRIKLFHTGIYVHS